MAEGNTDITIQIRAIDEATQIIQNVSKSVGNLGGASTQAINQFTTSVNKATNNIKKLGMQTGIATQKTRKFKMEYLSIMFAGMALSRVFGGLIRAQMDLFGVTEMLGGAWTIVLLPVMEAITPLIYSLLEVFMNLPQGVQMAIGVFAIFATIIGGLLMVIGQIVLGLHGISLAWGGISAGAAAAGTTIGAIAGTILIWIGVILVAIAAIWYAWKTNFMNIREDFTHFINGVRQYFNGLISIVSGVLDIIKGLFTGEFELIKQGVVKIFGGIWDFLLGGFKMMLMGVVIVFKSAFMLVWNITRAVVNGFIEGINWVLRKVGSNKSINYRMPSLKVPSFKEGGIMPHTGLAMLHAGERIIPANQVGSSYANQYSPQITVNANVSSSYDVRKLASELNQYWARDFEKIAKGR